MQLPVTLPLRLQGDSLTNGLCIVHSAHVSTKTVSLKVEAYNRLKAARRYPGESFSEVVLRATWPEDTTSAGEFLALRRDEGLRLRPEEVDRLEEFKRLDRPAVDKWAAH